MVDYLDITSDDTYGGKICEIFRTSSGQNSSIHLLGSTCSQCYENTSSILRPGILIDLLVCFPRIPAPRCRWPERLLSDL